MELFWAYSADFSPRRGESGPSPMRPPISPFNRRPPNMRHGVSAEAAAAGPSNPAVARGGHPSTFAGLSHRCAACGDRLGDHGRNEGKPGQPRDLALREPFASRNLDQRLGHE
jgi:hypothetical protein